MRAILLGTSVQELKKYRDQVDTQDDHGRTALRFAVELANLDGVKELLDNLGANVDLGDVYQTTPLHAACSRGDGDIVDVLLRKVKEINALNNRGETALICACRHMNWEIVPKLSKCEVAIADSGGKTALHWVMQNITTINDCLDAIEFLLTNRANVNAQDSRGRSPLHLAAGRGLSDACTLLVKRGARLNITDDQGETPIHRCVVKPSLLQGKSTVLQTLVELKADVSIKRSDGKTAHDIIASLLVERTWNDNQKVAFTVADRRLKKALEDLQKA